MSTSLFQYAKTTDPDVIAAIKQRSATKREWKAKVRAWVAQFNETGDFYTVTGFGSLGGLSGVLSKEKPTAGQWKQGRRSDAWIPYKNNPLYAEFKALGNCPVVTVPGIPSVVVSAIPGAGYSTITFTPHPFIYDGVAWVGVSDQPAEDSEQWENADLLGGHGWTEVRASEFHAAMEGYNEQRRIESEKAA